VGGSLQWRWTPRVTLELFDRTRVTSTVRTSGASIGARSKGQRKYTGRKKFGAPLVCAADEARQEILKAAQNTRAWATIIIMFALFPECGSLVED